MSIDPDELAEHAFEPKGEEFQQRLYDSSVLVTGENFGCGSAREQAATCLIGAGVEAVVARSFARAFFRNAINNGLPAVESPRAAEAVQDGDEVWIDFDRGIVEANGESFPFDPYPPVMQQILQEGGLIPYLSRTVEEEAG